MIERERVPGSTNVASVGYDAGRGVLAVEYMSGAVYEYASVPEGLWKGLRACMEEEKSVGQFLIRAVKGKFEYRKIEEATHDAE